MFCQCIKNTAQLCRTEGGGGGFLVLGALFWSKMIHVACIGVTKKLEFDPFGLSTAPGAQCTDLYGFLSHPPAIPPAQVFTDKARWDGEIMPIPTPGELLENSVCQYAFFPRDSGSNDTLSKILLGMKHEANKTINTSSYCSAAIETACKNNCCGSAISYKGIEWQRNRDVTHLHYRFSSWFSL